jgi:hypothetical protein
MYGGRCLRGLPVLVQKVSRRVWGLRLRRTVPGLALASRQHVAFRQSESVGVLIEHFRSSIPSPPIPLFTLHCAPRGTQRKTRGRVDRYSFLVRNLHSLLPAGLSRRTRLPAFGSLRFPGDIGVVAIEMHVCASRRTPAMECSASITASALSSDTCAAAKSWFFFLGFVLRGFFSAHPDQGSPRRISRWTAGVPPLIYATPTSRGHDSPYDLPTFVRGGPAPNQGLDPALGGTIALLGLPDM